MKEEEEKNTGTRVLVGLQREKCFNKTFDVQYHFQQIFLIVFQNFIKTTKNVQHLCMTKLI